MEDFFIINRQMYILQIHISPEHWKCLNPSDAVNAPFVILKSLHNNSVKNIIFSLEVLEYSVLLLLLYFHRHQAMFLN